MIGVKQNTDGVLILVPVVGLRYSTMYMNLGMLHWFLGPFGLPF
jgi:hypothetical protein